MSGRPAPATIRATTTPLPLSATGETNIAEIDAAGLLRRAGALLLFDGLRRVPPLQQLVGVLHALAALAPGGLGPGGLDAVPTGSLERVPSGGLDAGAAYGALFRALAESPVALAPGGGGALRAALVDALLVDENPLSRAAQRQRAVRGEAAAVPPALLAAAASDLRTLQALVDVGPLLPAAVAAASALPEVPPWWDGAPAAAAPEQRAAAEEGMADAGATAAAPRQRFARQIAAGADWGALAAELVDHYARHGSGLFARSRAFRWAGALDLPALDLPDGVAPADGTLAFRPTAFRPTPGALRRMVPIPFPDAVRPTDLIGYTQERALLRRNTVQFLAGYPANNVLLYGDRGTGKSSSIKALLNEDVSPPSSSSMVPSVSSTTPHPADLRGAPGSEPSVAEHQPATGRAAGGGAAVDWGALRLIEVPKAHLADFPAIVALLRGRPQRFVLFVDDLSFEEGETQYKDMKAMLEGGIEARPPNVVVYATSNRRHLIRESFTDRASPDSEEVHAGDTVQEKLSFADRFGVTITFPTPDQAGYLAIVEGLARQHGLPITPLALRARAIEWAAWHNGRSGRTARQFVDHLVGELGLAAGTP